MEDIVIYNALGVCSAEEDTRILARVSAEEAPAGGRTLDLGTGTGYVAIYLARRGLEVEAVDVSERALGLAGENIRRNNVPVRLYRSDLFSAVQGQFDVIAFNPPMNPRETELTRWVTSFLRRHRRTADLLMRVFDRWLQSSRMGFLLRFMEQAKGHLRPGGCVVLEATRAELDALEKELASWRVCRRVDIPSLPAEQIAVFRPAGERDT
ncbi:MAG: methyltransferase [Anaerolineae bacterium]